MLRVNRRRGLSWAFEAAVESVGRDELRRNFWSAIRGFACSPPSVSERKMDGVPCSLLTSGCRPLEPEKSNTKTHAKGLHVSASMDGWEVDALG